MCVLCIVCVCVYIYTHTYIYIVPFAAIWMDYNTKWSNPDRERQISWYHLYVESKNSYTNELIYKTEIDSQT